VVAVDTAGTVLLVLAALVVAVMLSLMVLVMQVVQTRAVALVLVIQQVDQVFVLLDTNTSRRQHGTLCKNKKWNCYASYRCGTRFH
tara:strand:- start:4 stop:261 length:258 start_codon:yes stop_codon:yes gene_type:complete